MRKMSFLLVSVLLISAFFTGCAQSVTDPKPETNTGTSLEELAAAEVKDYKGKDLSSILDFRENSIKGPQYIDISTYTLKVDGLVEKPTDFTYDQVLKNTPHTKVVTLNCVEGWSVDILWEGFLLKDIFNAVQVKSDADTVIFYSYDGYSTSLPLQIILDKDIILAYKMNGLVLPPERGYPFQLVAEDKLGYKWAKWITRIELSSDSDYKGYWEQEGYSNEANVDN